MAKAFSKMPWTSHEQQQEESSEQEQSLTTILDTPEERGDLTLLLANITESMRKTITNAFDPKLTGSREDQFAGASAEENFQNANVDPSKVDVEAEDRRRKEEEKRKKELSVPATKELKDAALQHFDNWRDSVLTRVGEVVNSREEAKDQKKEARPAAPDFPNAAARSTANFEKQDEEVTNVLSKLYPPIQTPLAKLPEDKRALIMHSLLLLLLSLEHYSSYSRVLLLYVTSSLHLSIDLLSEDEAKISRALLTAVDEMSADSETKKKAEENASSRKWKVGLASAAGAALIGVTGGLAAPLLAAGIGTVMGGLGLGATAAAGYLGTLAGSSVLVGGLFGAYGGRMTGKMIDQYAKEVEDFAFVPVREFHRPRKVEKEFRRLRVAIGISGWLTDKDEVVKPWLVLAPTIEGFALRWELESLLNLGNSLSTMVKSAAWSVAKSEIIKQTVFSALTAGLWPLALLKVATIVDNPFSVARSRSEKAGEVLADALINKAQGERPVTLVGYSLGARVIYTCLMTLAERKAFGLIESVVLLGAPAPSTAADWRKIRSVVAGRVVNVYSTKDYILAFLYRTSSVQYGVAGLQEIKGVKGIQNVDVSDMVSGHTAYRHLTGPILKKIGFEDISKDEVAREERELKEDEEKEEQERKKNEKAKNKDGKDVDDQDVQQMEQEVEQKNEKTMKARAAEKFNTSRAAVTNKWNDLTDRTKKSGEQDGEQDKNA